MLVHELPITHGISEEMKREQEGQKSIGKRKDKPVIVVQEERPNDRGRNIFNAVFGDDLYDYSEKKKGCP